MSTNLDAAEFRAHRQRLVDAFKASGLTEGLIVYEAPPQPQERFTTSDLPFFQDGLFFWLTGWSDPDAAIIIDIATGQSIFLLPDYPKSFVIWHGSVPTADLIVERSGVDKVDIIPHLSETIAAFSPSIVYSTPERITFEFPNLNRHTLLTAASIARTVKSPAEINALRIASQVTGEAIVDVFKHIRWHEGLSECDIQAYFEFRAAIRGCRDFSFKTIVGSGPNACFLHYDINSRVVKQSDLIVLDCGVFYQHYAGDITRTFPASGKFTVEQAAVYNALLTLQKSLCSHVGPGVGWKALADEMREGIFAILIQLGIVESDVPYDQNIADFFVPHGLSHHIGCNVHDLCHYESQESTIQDPRARFLTLAPGHVISIEPGIYFHPIGIAHLEIEAPPPFDKIKVEIAKKYSLAVGGIRIEDDVLVTETGSEILSSNCPKEISEIEALFAGPSI